MKMVEIDMEDFNTKLNKAMNIIGIELTEALKEELDKKHGKDTGKLQSSIRYSIQGDELTISMAEHGRYLEFGTPPHFPPVEELKGWCARKWGDENLAYVLANHIAKFGTRPFPFIRSTVKTQSKKIVKEALIEAFK